MLNPFRKSQAAGQSVVGLAHAEHALIAEALLGASACLIGRPDALAAAKEFCESIVAATPNITLVFVWFGDLRADAIEPQVAAGPVAPVGGRLRIDRSFFASPGADVRATVVQRTRSFDVSPTSFHAPWRAAATAFGARSILTVPIANVSDERGWLVLCAARPGYFEAASMGLFETLGQLLYATLVHSRQQTDRPTEDSTDSVTGLINRRQARKQLEQAWQLPSEHETRGLLVIADLDGFRAINDDYGRMIGNFALRQVAQSLLNNVRKTDLAARWGCDRFMVWLPGVSATVAGTTAEKLRAAIAQIPVPSSQADGALMSVTIGATPVTELDSFATAHDRADRALQRAKQGSRGCVVVARPGA